MSKSRSSIFLLSNLKLSTQKITHLLFILSEQQQQHIINSLILHRSCEPVDSILDCRFSLLRGVSEPADSI